MKSDQAHKHCRGTDLASPVHAGTPANNSHCVSCSEQVCAIGMFWLGRGQGLLEEDWKLKRGTSCKLSMPANSGKSVTSDSI